MHGDAGRLQAARQIDAIFDRKRLQRKDFRLEHAMQAEGDFDECPLRSAGVEAGRAEGNPRPGGVHDGAEPPPE